MEHVGSARSSTYHYKNRGVDEIVVHLTIEEYIDNQSLKLNSKAGDGSAGYHSTIRYSLQPMGSYTRLSHIEETEYQGFLPRLMSRLVTIFAQRALKKDMTKLKQIVEAA